MNRFLNMNTDGLAETHRSFVNSWECDENRHWNVQFYMRAFQQASEMFAVLQQDSNQGSATARIRHIRYHRELAEARLVHVCSGVVGEGPMSGRVVHFLHDSESGALAATALDLPQAADVRAGKVAHDLISPAMPRGIADDEHKPVDVLSLSAKGRAIASHYSICQAPETGADGQMAAQAIVSRFTDAAPAMWTHAGITAGWLAQTGQGRVAVEMKLTRFAPITAGNALVQHSWISAMSARTISVRHQITDAASGLALAAGEACGVVMDLTTRRATKIPDAALERFANWCDAD